MCLTEWIRYINTRTQHFLQAVRSLFFCRNTHASLEMQLRNVIFAIQIVNHVWLPWLSANWKRSNLTKSLRTYCHVCQSRAGQPLHPLFKLYWTCTLFTQNPRQQIIYSRHLIQLYTICNLHKHNDRCVSISFHTVPSHSYSDTGCLWRDT